MEIKWAWEDSNLHGLPQQILSLSRMPISPQARLISVPKKERKTSGSRIREVVLWQIDGNVAAHL